MITDEIKTAILVDGGFYRNRAYTLMGEKSPVERAKELESYCKRLLNFSKYEKTLLYRIFYYDCCPSSKKVFQPLLKKTIDLSKSSINKWMSEYLEELKKKRKFALRLGVLAEEQLRYNLKSSSLKALCNGKVSFENLQEEDFELNIIQKGVDMKIGVDIASLAYKKQVDRIILISGDSDFVPAAKLARREGIDFILDPMLNHIRPDLFEHIDGIRTKAKPRQDKSVNAVPDSNI